MVQKEGFNLVADFHLLNTVPRMNVKTLLLINFARYNEQIIHSTAICFILEKLSASVFLGRDGKACTHILVELYYNNRSHFRQENVTHIRTHTHLNLVVLQKLNFSK